MKIRTSFAIAFLLLVSAFGFGQTQIKNRCPSPNGTTYGSVLIRSTGDISITPCPTRSIIATGSIVGTGTINSGTVNFFPQYTGATTVSATPFSWDGTTYTFNKTAGFAADAFRLEFVPSNAGTGTIDIGNVNTSTARIRLSDSGHTVTINATTALVETGVASYQLNRTVTAGGTTGAQTINKPNGSVNIAAGQSSIVITNSIVTTSTLVNAVANTNDATCAVKNAVATANTITITMTANCTAETRVAFWAWN